ncbi:hypothetical protein Calag_1562 [Caldisphaera lagunensis DSM 15908]|uniref:3-methyladenine DNA glycosylase/8-oxoguanine DNA glycosylase n=1 Tax=Caldisphaera lagunensis (strain DSM 15908 / JCM 11604 / ANMR 0165 / IC-154) TaxID=1056495 RepID=L0ADX9_CALLD|nr:hypothetical protein [Caldisphaera lagunensis]AFZ71260.1 hypothetical protein Calag_1562 [Caldisphaera lagunensis DSM 15908]
MINDESLVKLKEITSEYIKKAYMLDDFVNRSKNSMRWGGIGILMVLDASFTSIGVNYFNAVIPAVLRFKENFYDTNEIINFNELANYNLDKLKITWKNERSWLVAKNISRVLSQIEGKNDRERLRKWASLNDLDKFKKEDLSKIKGVGIITYQYLRIMGGIDTLMPDKIVIKVINELFKYANIDLKQDKNTINYIKQVEEIFRNINVEPVKITWMSWLIDSEAKKILSGKYNNVLNLI